MNILKFLKYLKGIPNNVSLPEDRPHDMIVEIFTKGNCYNFAFAMKALEPKIKVYTSKEISHCWFEYNGLHYDIKGSSTHLKAIYDDGLAIELIEDDLKEDDMDNYSIVRKGPMI